MVKQTSTVPALVIMGTLIVILFYFQYLNTKTINNIATNSQGKFDSIESRFTSQYNTIDSIRKQMEEKTDKKTFEERIESLRSGYYDFYDEFRTLEQKINARIPVMKKI